ncbi:AHH domain-containing protein [Rummeliibacillus suwonensis]|uniref:AHH domain-containing protein n=1 Tax=Rummeliibacillus suwonensis TaxID=1306154 RepID=UPI001C96B63A|nr:AHH domain-containing protein [Rummeliibacillus suwonensis]
MTTAKATTKVGVHKVKDAAEKIPTLNLYPYAPQHQLAGVNAGIVPYNTVNSVGLRDQLISMAKSTTKPIQKHHYSTNKSKKYTPKIEEITKKYDLGLDDDWNKELLPHQGRHPNAYHEYVLERLRTFDKIAKGDKEKFLKLYEQLKQKVRENPDMLYKDYWRKQ